MINIKRIGVFLVSFIFCMSCVYFGGAELYTGNFGFGMFCSFIFAIFLVILTEDVSE